MPETIIKQAKPGDLAVYMKYAGKQNKAGDRILSGWIAIITKVKNSSFEVFDPDVKHRYRIRFSEVINVMEGIDDLGETYALSKLRFMNMNNNLQNCPCMIHEIKEDDIE